MRVFRVGYFLRYPEAGFVIHHRENVLHVTVKLHVEFVSTLSIANLRSYLVKVPLHQSRILGDPVVDGLVRDLHTISRKDRAVFRKLSPLK